MTTASRQQGPSDRGGREGSLQTQAVAAGLGLVLIAAFSVFANFLVLEKLVTPGDALRTATDVLASKSLFQWGIAAWFVIAALDILVAWPLFRFFSPTNRRLAMVSSALRVLYGSVLVVAISRLMDGLRLLGNAQASETQALNRFEGFTDIWHLGLILFGIHLLVAGYVAYRSGYVSRLVGASVALAGFGYVSDAAVRAVVDNPPFELSVITGMGEFVLAVWLLSKGRRISLHETPVAAHPVPAPS